MNSLIPLIVDFDRTFLRNDFFEEQLVIQLIRNPFKTLSKFVKSNNWVDFKMEILDNYKVVPEVFESLINRKVLDEMDTAKANGRAVICISASPQNFLDRVIPDGYFHSIIGSKDYLLKGKKKLEFIIEKYGDKFDYIGDSPSDDIILKEAVIGIKV